MTPRHRASWPGWVSARGGRFRLEEGRQVPRAPAMFRMFRLRGGVARGETGLASTGRRRAPRPRSPVRNFLRLVVTATGDGQFRFDVVKEAERKTTRSTTRMGTLARQERCPSFFVWGEHGCESDVRHGSLSIAAKVAERRRQSSRRSKHCRTRRAGMAVDARGGVREELRCQRTRTLRL